MPPSSQTFAPDRLLAALPRREIERLPAGTSVPRRRSFGDLGEYNGFTGKERMRTHGVLRWLISVGAASPPATCGVCGGAADQTHAENYYDLATWIDMCRGCHGRLHRRFALPLRWAEHLDRCAVPTLHWSRLIATEPFDLAGLLRRRGAVEPVYETFVEQAADAPLLEPR